MFPSNKLLVQFYLDKHDSQKSTKLLAKLYYNKFSSLSPIKGGKKEKKTLKYKL